MTNAGEPPGPEKCPACGADAREGAYYCWLCGHSLRGASPATRAERRRPAGMPFLAGCLVGPFLVLLSMLIALRIICSR